MFNHPRRIVILVKDVMIITGMSERSASRLLVKIRKSLNRRAGAFISVEEFCVFTKLDQEKVESFL